MTFAVSATSIPKRRRAFTLIELLVVIGIIVVLVGFTVPMVMKSYRAGERARTQADLNSIATALEAFKNDFGDYPRPDSSGSNTGFATLGRYLIGPYGDGMLPAVTPAPPLPDPTDPPVLVSGTTYNPRDSVAATLGGQTNDAVASTSSPPPTSNTPPDTWAPFTVTDSHGRWPRDQETGRRTRVRPVSPARQVQDARVGDSRPTGKSDPVFSGGTAKTEYPCSGPPGCARPTSEPILGALYNANDNEIFFRHRRIEQHQFGSLSPNLAWR